MIRLLLIGLTRFLVGGQSLWIGCRPETRQRIYFANHASHLDTLLIWASLPAHLRGTTHPVAAADYWGIGSLRRYIATHVLNAVLIDRRPRRTAGGGPLAALEEKLGAGGSLILFPEGTRSQERLPAAFKPGLYHLACEYPAVEMVPVYLDNLQRAFPKGTWFPVPISCVARFGPPIRMLPGEPRNLFLARARDAVVALS